LNCWKCGHKKDQHDRNALNKMSLHFCYDCGKEIVSSVGPMVINIYTSDDGRQWSQKGLEVVCHNFETNLDYIERLAKEKGLI
jgi:hypothetical protein